MEVRGACLCCSLNLSVFLRGCRGALAWISNIILRCRLQILTTSSHVLDPSERGAFSSGSRQRAQEPADGSAAPLFGKKCCAPPEPGIAALPKALPA